jgi:hemolysin-activating ACP:hemolysin acyltransferase
MWKTKKAKDMAGDARERGSAAQAEAPARGSLAPTGNSEEAVAMSGSVAGDESEKVAAPASVAGASQRPATVRQVDLTLGQIVSVPMRSATHKHYSLADLEWLVLPAVLSGQYRVAQAQQSGAPAPIGVVLWASVSADVDKRLSDLSAPARLRPDEWRSGNIPWLMELVCDARVQQALLKGLGDTIFKGLAIKMRVRGADGKMQIAVLKGAAETKQA